MENSYEFLSLILDSISEHIVIIDKMGTIKFVNKSWVVFGDNNACMVGHGWSGVNYLEDHMLYTAKKNGRNKVEF
jgi:hypothetical protein